MNPRFANNPRWFWETVALYENGEFVDPRSLDYVVRGAFPTLQQLNVDPNGGTQIYQLGYVLGEFIVVAVGPRGLPAADRDQRRSAGRARRLRRRIRSGVAIVRAPAVSFREGCAVLVAEDDQVIADFVAQGLREAGYAVDVATTGTEALRKALEGGYDAAVMDVMLPELDGLSVIEQLRAKKQQMPVLILSARHTVDDRVKGLQAGGDDYLTKPFAFAELLARLQALLRRSGGASEPTRLTVGELTLDLLSRRVERGGKPLDLRPREFALLEYLMRHPGRVLSKTMILSHVWGYSFDPGTNVVDVLVSRLRDKVDEGFDTKLIHTVRGAGYVLKVD